MSARARKQKAADAAAADKSEATTQSTFVTKTTTTERSRTSAATPQQSFSRSERSQSPLNISRTEEKDELAHLNDRLAGYIDYVRKLEVDKERLTRRIHSVTEERMSKVEEARKTYEDEILALRQLVDDLAKQKTKAELDAKQAKDDANEAKLKLSKRDQEIRTLHRRIENLEKDLAEFKQDHDRYGPLLSDYHALEKRFEDVQRDLEAETLLRTDLENKILGLKEQLDFRTRLFDEEREKLVQRTMYIEEEVEGRKKAEYENRLADELRSIRDQTATDLEDYKAQIAETFESKLGQLRTSADLSADDAIRHRSELLEARKRVDELEHDLSKKIAEIDVLQRRVEDLQRQLDQERRDHEMQLAAQRQEVRRLKDELEESFREFAELMNTKIALDQEILMYRKMLEGEESRLNIQPQTRDSPFNIQPGNKRRRVEDGFEVEETEGTLTGTPYNVSKARYAYRVSSTASGPVEFFKEQDTQGKWVKIHNPSTEDVSLGGWEIVHQAGGEETRFKFHRSLVLKPGTTCTIWSSDTDTTHNPPADVVMKNKSFHAGSDATISLLDSDGTEQAKCTVKRERIRASGVSFGRRAGYRTGTDEKCMVM
ncbi:unnamed protein product [Calicophoron daubneyi]|uniref:Lamin n=1 Tax=Calicophoron daubneyi TaxID=300641 RepID=A0AAV2TLK3_CALDB